MERIRVLIFVTPCNYPVIMGGTLGRLLKWSQGYNYDLFDVYILISGNNKANLLSLSNEFLKYGFKIYTIPNLTLPRVFFRNKSQSNLLKTIKEIAPDIVHTLFIQSDLIMSYLKKRCKIPYIISSIEGALYPTGSCKSLIYRLIYFYFRNRIDKVISLCKFAEEQAVSKYNVLKNRCVIIYSGIKIDAFDFPKRIKSNLTPLKIGFLGDISAGKRIDLFIDTIFEIVKLDKSTKFIIGGIGRDLERIKGKVRILDIDNHVEFRGFVDDVNDFFKEIDIYVFLSFREGLPWVILESQAAGVPTIASAVGGVTEVIIDGYNGVLLNEGTKKELKNKIYFLLQNQDLRKKFSVNSRKVAIEKFNQKREIFEIQSLYLSLKSNTSSSI